MFCQVCGRRLSRFELDVVSQNIKKVELTAASYLGNEYHSRTQSRVPFTDTNGIAHSCCISTHPNEKNNGSFQDFHVFLLTCLAVLCMALYWPRIYLA